MYCNRCSTALDPQAVACPLCSTSLLTQNAVVAEQQKRYTWGKIQGRLLILMGLAKLVQTQGMLSLAVTMGAIVLGISILRRNRLILPLMAVLVMVQTMWFVAVQQARPDRYHTGLISVLVWSFFFAYYYKRREEFVSWW